MYKVDNERNPNGFMVEIIPLLEPKRQSGGGQENQVAHMAISVGVN
jgi:hypothetical protein